MRKHPLTLRAQHDRNLRAGGFTLMTCALPGW